MQLDIVARPRRSTRGSARVSASEDGFTLVEAMASALIIMLVVGASVSTAMTGYRAARETKFFQQATALGNAVIEAARDLHYDDLVMVDSDLAGDPAVLSACAGFTSGKFFVPGPGLSCEELVSGAVGGAIDDHLAETSVAGKSYSVAQYVTWVDADTQGGTQRDYKRLTVIIRWDSGGTQREYQTSTFITRARRGLPAPKFTLSPSSQTKEVEPGASVVVPHSIKNLGIVDAYDVTLPVPAGWSVAFYEDLGEIGVYESGVDIALTDTNGTGIVDTGSITTNEIVHFMARVTVPSTADQGSHALTLTATSGADASVSQTASDTVRVRPVGLHLYLHNNPTPPTGHTNAVTYLDMNDQVPIATTLYRYSDSYYSGLAGGRYLETSTVSPTQSDNRLMAAWVYQHGPSVTLQGNGEVRLWVAARDLACDKAINVQVYVREKDARTTTRSTFTLASATATLAAPGGTAPCEFRSMTIPITVNRSVPANRYLELKVEVTGLAGDATMVAYDAVDFKSTLVLPLAAT